jgi:Big-like domain-containing protein
MAVVGDMLILSAVGMIAVAAGVLRNTNYVHIMQLFATLSYFALMVLIPFLVIPFSLAATIAIIIIEIFWVVVFQYGNIIDSSPTVVAVTPMDGAANVQVDSYITARFSESMQSSTITNDTFTLRDRDSNHIAGKISSDGLTATFKPSVNLSYNTKYTAAITTGVTDKRGNPLVSDKIWSFITEVR